MRLFLYQTIKYVFQKIKKIGVTCGIEIKNSLNCFKNLVKKFFL
jgi:hypothetical protein